MHGELSSLLKTFAMVIGFVLAIVALYATNLNVSELDCPSSPGRNITQSKNLSDAAELLGPAQLQADKDGHGKNWTIVKWFDVTPPPEELATLLPELNKRNVRLMYSYNPQSERWSECIVSWKAGTWQHTATMRLQRHADRAAHANSSMDVIRVLGYRWGFGSGISSLSRSMVHAIVKDQPVRGLADKWHCVCVLV
jgi:hypothetical protein